MRPFHALFACLGVLLLACRVQASDPIPVRVDPNVELLSIVFRFAGAGEYNQSSSQSPYADEVEKHFGPFKDHPVVKLAAQLRESDKIGFDAVMSFAVHLKSGALVPKIPFDAATASLDRHWKPAAAARFLAALKQFAADSKAEAFFAAHQDYYQKAAERLNVPLSSRPYRAWLDSFFGARPGAQFSALVGLLNGGANYGVSVHYPDGKLEILPVIGADKFDDRGLPVFDSSANPLIVHEFCHTYTNAFVDRFAEGLTPSAEKIYPYRKALLAKQAYANPRTMLYESMVRACTVRFALDNETPQTAAAQLQEEIGRGFLWTAELVELLGRYEKERDRYPTFQDFMPEVVAFFAQTAASIEAQMARLPKIVSLSPANGEKGVDPATTEIRIVFDRPMRPDSYAIFGDPAKMPPAAQTPEGPAKPRFSANGKTVTLKVRLEPGKTYAFSLNSVYRSGFFSAEGLPLDPVDVTFTTATP
jgi:hypothetical protein